MDWWHTQYEYRNILYQVRNTRQHESQAESYKKNKKFGSSYTEYVHSVERTLSQNKKPNLGQNLRFLLGVLYCAQLLSPVVLF